MSQCHGDGSSAEHELREIESADRKSAVFINALFKLVKTVLKTNHVRMVFTVSNSLSFVPELGLKVPSFICPEQQNPPWT